MNKLSLITNGIIKENPVLILLLGTCPTLAVTTSAINGLGMGFSTMAVLVSSNIVIALLKNIIPDKVRIPSFIVVIAGFVTIVGLLLQAYAPEINEALGLFIPLIVVNCIILGRAEMFASKNKVIDSAFDGIGMGLGFTFALFLMGSIREFLGSGAWMGLKLTANLYDPISVFMLAPGAFFTYGCLVALINYVSKGKAIKKTDFGCEGCPSAAGCQQIGMSADCNRGL
ncbi:Electron transport complex protein RnfE [Pelotomaculum schinkii]|uniref:Ion-translocating oxidoreductase complex subunit E n=1 Tax=Pelotomaculum schinkii TaxID=78350 RepID=A0A4Y7RGW1_9FIRM|nr:electron transport complex subunit E [Pelotomaculum schinkii]TEB08056.1 Electron transport complex protein RnfE [Pelotomaculum schinkii]